ncbi:MULTISPECIES: hypothetical protein [unclassified Variovorax]|uniref:beta strand repeat-containing protein n=1 Tax=unclassified Variovorax TaxID=663243 RepID=UPI0009FD1B15|nr:MULTISPECIES: hypothetical protein [unclassified Variovorax]PNG53319.1 hypothetical protein CHC06_04666 [Variovorax sp. B2]PNG53891.1 hypothetical protein CHC07_03713 [Variovorax sp. B4]VTV11356.1 Hep_Hag [Variovorax sp. WDL1]
MRKLLPLVAVLMLMPSSVRAQMDGDFSIGGAIRVGTSATACDAAAAGGIRYNSVSTVIEFCNGTLWQTVGAGASASAASPNRGIQFNSGGSLAADAGLTFSSTGMLGIGVSTPSHHLTIVGDNSYDPLISLMNSNSTGVSGMQFYDEFGAFRGTLGHYNFSYGGTNFAVNDPLAIVSNTQDIAFITGDTGIAPGTVRMIISATNGNIGIGTSTVTPQADLDVGGTGAVLLARGTAAQRPSSPVNGMLRYNSQTGKFEGYQAGAWVDMIGGGSAASPDRGIQFNSGGSFAADAGLTFSSTGGLMVSGTYTGTASAPASGAGTRMFFDVQKAAFRAGTVNGTQWDNASIGNYSVAMGYGTIASGAYSTAMGYGAIASSDYSTAMGSSTASGFYSTALGWGTASGNYSTALGRSVVAGNGTAGSGFGDGSIALGLIDNAVTITTRSQVTGIQSMGIFMGDQDGLVVSANNQMSLLGGKMVIDPKVPATNLAADTALEVDGTLKIASGAETCDAAREGSLRYLSSSDAFEACATAGSWTALGGGASVASPDRGIQFNSGGGFAADAGLTFSSTGDLMVSGTYTGTASVPASGAGTRTFFDVQKAAFRAGAVNGTQWDNANIGNYSVAIGESTTASGGNSTAMGAYTTASGTWSTAMGTDVIANGDISTAMGANTTASGAVSTAMGDFTTAGGVASTAMGSSTTASGDYSTTMGYGTTASYDYSTAMGYGTTASGAVSTAMGRRVTAGNGTAGSGSGDGSMALGLIDDAVVITTPSQVTGIQSMGIFMGDQDGLVVSANNQMSLLGGKMVIDPKVPATNLAADTALEIDGTLKIASGAESCDAAREGSLRYLSSSDTFEVCATAGNWTVLGGGGSIDDLSDARTMYSSGNMFLGHEATALTTAVQNTAVGAAALDSATTGGYNTAMGFEALTGVTTGQGNVGVGLSAGAGITSGANNIYIGWQSGYINNKTGDGNIGIGTNVLFETRDGAQNIAIGEHALRENWSGNQSVAIGYEAMRYANSSSTAFTTYNTAVGYHALMGSAAPANNTGIRNTALGYAALTNITGGSNNTAIGAEAAERMRPAGNSANTALGHQALRGSTTVADNTGISNVAIGDSVMEDITSGSGNTAVGTSALANVTSGSANTVFGQSAAYELTTASDNVLIGVNSAYNTTIGARNTTLGLYTLNSNVAGSQSVAVGYEAMRYANSSGTAFDTLNTAVGYQALRGSPMPSANIGFRNTAVGYQVLMNNTTGSFNQGFGTRTLFNNTTGSDNYAFGEHVLYSNTAGGLNVAFGDYVLYDNTIGSENMAFGVSTLSTNVAGSRSTAFGYEAMRYANDSGSSFDTYNTAVGYQALMGSTSPSANTGISNTALGYQALTAAESGSDNVAVGAGAGSNITTGSWNIVLGAGTQVPSATGSAQLNIGDAIYGDLTNDRVRIGGAGAVSAFSDLELAGSLAVKISSGTTAQRPGTPANGMLRYNATTNKFEGYQAGAWTDMIGGAGGAIDDLSDAITQYSSSSMFLGTGAGTANTAEGGTALGVNAMGANTIGEGNTAVGLQALGANTDGSSNTAIGSYALMQVEGGHNTAMGNIALWAITSGNNNVAIGGAAGGSLTSSEGTVVIGQDAMGGGVSSSDSNTVIGAGAVMTGSGSISNNTVMGWSAGLNLQSNDNVLIGYSAGSTTTTGSGNILIGNSVTAPAATTSNALNVGNTIYGDLATDSITVGTTAGQVRALPPAAEVIGAGATVTANACGTVKRISATAARTTSTTNTFTAPAAANAGCCMDVINTSANNITLDANTNFRTIGAADQVVGQYDAIRVCSDGASWYQVSAVAGNQ